MARGLYSLRVEGIDLAIVVGMNRPHDAVPKREMSRIVVRHVFVMLVMKRHTNHGRGKPRHLSRKIFISGMTDHARHLIENLVKNQNHERNREDENGNGKIGLEENV